MTELRWGSATDTGVVRTNNEDSLLVAEPLFAVADGMGGHAGGEVASTVAVEALRVAFAGDQTVDGLVAAVRQANAAVLERASAEIQLRGMGTTLTALALVTEDGEARLALVNVGDSRAYLLQQGELSRLTEDHSLVEELVREGQMSPEEAATHPQRHVVTRALGMGPGVEPDVWQILPVKGDRILLCSDGLPNEVAEDDIAATLRHEPDANHAAEELVRLARQHGGADNITVVVVDVADDDDRAREASAAVGGSRAKARPLDLEPRGHPDPDLDPDPDRDRDRDPEPDHAAASARAQPATKPRGSRRFTFRVALFVVALVAVLAVGVWAVAFYGRAGYYVGLDRDSVTIYKGRPGGLLWINPTVAQRTDLKAAQVLPAELPGLRSGHTEPSLAAARHFVDNLKAEAAPPAPTGP